MLSIVNCEMDEIMITKAYLLNESIQLSNEFKEMLSVI